MITNFMSSEGGLKSGGTISGDVTISGDLTVSGGGSMSYSEVLTGDMAITNTAATVGLTVNQSGAAYAISINQDANSPAIYIDTEATSQHGIHIASPAITSGTCLNVSSANSLNDGRCAYFHSNSSSTNTRDLVMIYNEHASATGTTALKIQQDSTGYALNAVSASAADVTVANFQSAIDANGEHSIIRVGHGSKAAYMGLLLNSADTAYFGIDDNPDDGNGIYVNESGQIGIGTKVPASLLHIEDSSGTVTMRIKTGGNSPYKPGIILATSGDVAEFQAYGSTGEVRIGGIGSNYFPTFYSNNSEAMRIDTSGNVGIGATPVAMHADNTLLQVGSTATIFAQTASGAGKSLYIGQNVFRHTDGTWDTIVNDEQTLYEQNAGVHYFYSGAAHASVATLVTNMKIDINSRISLSNNDGGTNNTLFGKNTGAAITSGGNYNCLFGHNSGLAVNTGDSSVMIGYSTGSKVTTASKLILIGEAAGGEITVTGGSNVSDGTVAIGHNALTALTGGARNTAIGYNAGLGLSTSSDCTLVGYMAGEDMDSLGSTPQSCTYIGGYAGRFLDDGTLNTAVGHGAMEGTTGGSSCSENAAFGHHSLTAITSGDYNTAIGADSLKVITTQSNNTAVGFKAGEDSTGANNIYVGFQAGSKLTGGYSTFIGYNAGSVHTTGGYNMAIGYGAMDDTNAGNNSLGSNENVFIGVDSGGGTWADTSSSNNVAVGNYTMDAALDGAINNVAVGKNALGALTTGDGNTALGNHSMGTSTVGSHCVAIGAGAIDSATTSSNIDGTVAVGSSALTALTTGAKNTAVGYNVLAADTDGGSNVAIGYEAGKQLTGSTRNTIVGQGALSAPNGTADNLADCVVVGYEAFKGHADNTTTGANGTIAIGKSALTALTSGQYNIAIGYNSMDEHTTGRANTCLGYGTMSQSGGDVTAQDNTFIGASSGSGDWAGAGVDQNTAVGYSTMTGAMTNADHNSAFGAHALQNLTGGDDNSAFGAYAGANITTGHSNIIIGRNALTADQDGTTSVVIGYEAADGLTGSTDNTIVGYRACGNFDSTADNLAGVVAIGTNALYGSGETSNAASNTIAIGRDALKSLTTGEGNIAIGYQALDADDDGDHCTAVGYQALTNQTGVSGSVMNTAVGYQAGKYVSSGTGNTFIGFYAGIGIDATQLTGGNNTAVGRQAGMELEGAAHSNTFLGENAGATTEAGVENTCIGKSCQAQDDTATNQIVIGNNLTGTKDNAVFIGNDSSHIENDFNSDATWNHSSDRRQKTDIKDETLGLEFINDLRPVTYKHKSPSEFPKEWDSYDADDKEPMGGDKTIHGFIAQEVKQAMDNAGVDTFQGWSDGKDGRQRVSFEAMVMPLIKSVQELSAKVEDLEKQLKGK